MNAQTVVELTLKASIMLTVFGFGLQASLEDLLYLWRRPRLLVRSLLSMFVVMPLFAILLTRVFHFNPAVIIALIALSISPVPPLLPRRLNTGSGLAPYGLGLMATAALLAIVYIPLATYLIGEFFHRPLAIAPWDVAKVVLLSVLIPLVAGTLFRRSSPTMAERLAGPIVRVAGIVLLVGAVCILAFASRAAWALVGDGTIIAFIVFILVGLLVGHLFGEPDPDSRVVLALSTACRQPALALAIAAANFPDEHRVLAALLLYLVLSVVLTIPYIKWQRKAAMAHSAPA